MKYSDTFQMTVSTSEYSVSWTSLEAGIPMGCSISPIPFTLAMEMVLRGAERFAQGVKVADGHAPSPMRAFMDDITVLTRDTGGAT